MYKSTNILGSTQKDFISFYVPAAFVALVMYFTSFSTHTYLTLSVLIFLDTGHTYSTLFRTYFRKAERQRSRLYFWLPPIVFILLFIYSILGLPYLWRLVAYLTYFHHIRQNYGVFKWYCYNEKKQLNEERNIYLMGFVPFILFHLRDIDYIPIYHQSEYAFYEFKSIYSYILIPYSIYFIYLNLRFLNRFMKNEISIGLTAAYMFPAILNFLCFLIMNNSMKAFIPLLTMHATTYVSIIGLSTGKMNKNLKPSIQWICILSVMLICSISETWMSDYFNISQHYLAFENNYILSLIIACTLLPNMLHYIYDAFLWKRTNPDFQLILKGDH